jgi:hypothetical protein
VLAVYHLLSVVVIEFSTVFRIFVVSFVLFWIISKEDIVAQLC